VNIQTGEIIKGFLPSKAQRIVREWALEYQEELMTNWQRAVNLMPLERIPGADND
jgi:hypothetical protein